MNALNQWHQLFISDLNLLLICVAIRHHFVRRKKSQNVKLLMSLLCKVKSKHWNRTLRRRWSVYKIWKNRFKAESRYSNKLKRPNSRCKNSFKILSKTKYFQRLMSNKHFNKSFLMRFRESKRKLMIWHLVKKKYKSRAKT